MSAAKIIVHTVKCSGKHRNFPSATTSFQVPFFSVDLKISVWIVTISMPCFEKLVSAIFSQKLSHFRFDNRFMNDRMIWFVNFPISTQVWTRNQYSYLPPDFQPNCIVYVSA